MCELQNAAAGARIGVAGADLEQTFEHASVQPVTPDDIGAAVAAVVKAGRDLAAAGLVHGTSGNLSARVGDTLAVSATGAGLGELTPEQVTLVDLDGRVTDGRFAPTSELALHLEIYRRYGPGAVVHAHPLTATALACVLDELPCVHPDMLELGGSVRVAPYRPFGSREFAEITADALANRSAALMANHGTVVLGQDPAQATARTRVLEWAAELYWRAARIGEPRALDEAEQDELRAVIRRIDYGQPRPLTP